MAKCTCTYRDGEGPGAEPLRKDLYCPFHGRIRDMDAGASPFVDANTAAFAASEMYESDYQRRLQREANEADARRGRDDAMTREEFVEALENEVDIKIVAPEGHEKIKRSLSEMWQPGDRCTCTWVQAGIDEQWYLATVGPDCPIHG